jgi:hypothetical protein
MGKGQIMARLYDKGLEIRGRSLKTWMFDVWGIETIPDGSHAVRTEFQIRREILREMGIDTIGHLWPALPGLWAYLTGNWLKFVDRPDLHKDNQKLMGWWEIIQQAFEGDQAPYPLIRCQAVSEDQIKHSSQTYGCFTSFIASVVSGGVKMPDLWRSKNA